MSSAHRRCRMPALGLALTWPASAMAHSASGLAGLGEAMAIVLAIVIGVPCLVGAFFLGWLALRLLRKADTIGRVFLHGLTAFGTTLLLFAGLMAGALLAYGAAELDPGLLVPIIAWLAVAVLVTDGFVCGILYYRIYKRTGAKGGLVAAILTMLVCGLFGLVVTMTTIHLIATEGMLAQWTHTWDYKGQSQSEVTRLNKGLCLDSTPGDDERAAANTTRRQACRHICGLPAMKAETACEKDCRAGAKLVKAECELIDGP